MFRHEEVEVRPNRLTIYFKILRRMRRHSSTTVPSRMQRTRAPAGVAASLLYTTSMAKRTKRAFVKHRKYAALVTDQDLSQLRSLVTTGVCRSCVGCTHVHANVVDIAVYDASRSEETGHMIAVIEFDRPIACLLYTSPSPRD